MTNVVHGNHGPWKRGCIKMLTNLQWDQVVPLPKTIVLSIIMVYTQELVATS